MIYLSHIEIETTPSRRRSTGDLDPVFRAIAHRVRREILDELREGPKTTGELVMRFPGLSRYAVMQHLGVLESANLIVAHHEGRVRVNQLNAVPIRQIYERWVTRYEGHWASALIALKEELEGTRSPKPQESPAIVPDAERESPNLQARRSRRRNSREV